ncbi:MalK ABC-type sugar transport systems, ATPase components [Rhabdaerophilaceae bacterium]
MARVSVQSLSKTFGAVKAVDSIDLAIDNGEFVAILGPSGCGKSTTLFMLSGIETPTAGRVMFDDQDVTDLEAKARGIGLVFQSYALYPHMSVLENITFPLEMQALPKFERHERARRTADIVQIGELLDRRPHQLSGGQQQRVALARALVKEPRLLLLDEPLSNLDASLRHAMRSEIRRLQRRLKLTTVLVTHDQIEATTMADRIIIMNKGRVEQVGTADDLYRRPANLFVAGFIGSPAMNLVSVPLENGAMAIGSQTLNIEAQDLGAAIAGLRPEHLQFAADGIAGRIALVEPMGREVLYEVETALGVLRVLDPVHEIRHREGANVSVAISSEDILAFDPRNGAALPVKQAVSGSWQPRWLPAAS